MEKNKAASASGSIPRAQLECQGHESTTQGTNPRQRSAGVWGWGSEATRCPPSLRRRDREQNWVEPKDGAQNVGCLGFASIYREGCASESCSRPWPCGCVRWLQGAAGAVRKETAVKGPRLPVPVRSGPAQCVGTGCQELLRGLTRNKITRLNDSPRAWRVAPASSGLVLFPQTHFELRIIITSGFE